MLRDGLTEIDENGRMIRDLLQAYGNRRGWPNDTTQTDDEQNAITRKMLSKQRLSELLADKLDSYGYSEKRVQERIWVNDKTSVAKTLSTREIASTKQVDKFLVGSQREGISLYGESDADWMQINTSVVCTDKLKHMIGGRNRRAIFRMDRNHAPAGYTYLRYNEQDDNTQPYFDTLRHALEKTPNGTYLSSTRYMSKNEDVFYESSGCIGRDTVYRERKGPSIPKNVKEYTWIKEVLDQHDVCRDMDFVRGFQCFCPSALNHWLHRRRFCSWPTKDTIVEVAKLPYHVVPVGLDGSEHEHFQWRISFTMAEICLVKSFNETQRKMHILLRLLARHVLRSVAPDMTSYVMKNIAFLVAERTQQHKFVKDELFDRVMDAIDFLLTCVKKKHLPNYMTSERNLFHKKFPGKMRKRLIAKLQEVKVNGQMILSNLLQCQQIEIDFPNVHQALINADFIDYLDKMHCIPTFGMACLSNPMDIDLTEKLKETKHIWCRYCKIAKNKTNTKILYKLKPCGWLLSKIFENFRRPDVVTTL